MRQFCPYPIGIVSKKTLNRHQPVEQKHDCKSGTMDMNFSLEVGACLKINVLALRSRKYPPTFTRTIHHVNAHPHDGHILEESTKDVGLPQSGCSYCSATTALGRFPIRLSQ